MAPARPLAATLASLTMLGMMASAGCAHAAAQDAAPRAPGRDTPAADAPSDDAPASARDATAATEPPLAIPAGRLIAALDAERCTAILRSHGVRYDVVSPGDAPNVAQPVRLRGPIGGVLVEPRNASLVHEILDCRLAVALLAWAPALRAAGIDRIQHYSVFRPAARVHSTGRPSGHATGLAIDSALYRRAGAVVLDVLADWTERERGGPPCPVRDREPESARTLRSLVCAAVAQDLFQVVLTPHFDHAHQNHVHLEVVPGIDWSYVH